MMNCDLCPFRAKNPGALGRHKQYHNTNARHKCPFCTYSVQTYVRMLKHVKDCHPENDNGEGQLEEPDSSPKASKGATVTPSSHNESDEMVLPPPAKLKRYYKCPYCPFWAVAISYFKDHYIKHVSKEWYRCSQCPFSSSDRKAVQNHIASKKDDSHATAKVDWDAEVDDEEYEQHLVDKTHGSTARSASVPRLTLSRTASFHRGRRSLGSNGPRTRNTARPLPIQRKEQHFSSDSDSLESERDDKGGSDVQDLEVENIPLASRKRSSSGASGRERLAHAFVCPLCDFISRGECKFQAHYFAKHEGALPHRCTDCGFLGSSAEAVTKHISGSGHGRTAIPVLDSEAAGRVDFGQFRKSVARDDVGEDRWSDDDDLSDEALNTSSGTQLAYKCPTCNYATLDVVFFHEHILSHDGSKMIACTKCHFRDVTRRTVALHVTSQHDDEDAEAVLIGPIPKNKYNKFRKQVIPQDLSPDPGTPLRIIDQDELESASVRRESRKRPPSRSQSSITKRKRISTPAASPHRSRRNSVSSATIPPPAAYVCPHCHFSEVDRDLFHQHYVTHGKKSFHCSACSYKSNWNFHVARHIEKEGDDRLHQKARVLSDTEEENPDYRSFLKNQHLSRARSRSRSRSRSSPRSVNSRASRAHSTCRDNNNVTKTMTRDANETSVYVGHVPAEDSDQSNSDEEASDNPRTSLNLRLLRVDKLRRETAKKTDRTDNERGRVQSPASLRGSRSFLRSGKARSVSAGRDQSHSPDDELRPSSRVSKAGRESSSSDDRSEASPSRSPSPVESPVGKRGRRTRSSTRVSTSANRKQTPIRSSNRQLPVVDVSESGEDAPEEVSASREENSKPGTSKEEGKLDLAFLEPELKVELGDAYDELDKKCHEYGIELEKLAEEIDDIRKQKKSAEQTKRVETLKLTKQQDILKTKESSLGKLIAKRREMHEDLERKKQSLSASVLNLKQSMVDVLAKERTLKLNEAEVLEKRLQLEDLTDPVARAALQKEIDDLVQANVSAEEILARLKTKKDDLARNRENFQSDVRKLTQDLENFDSNQIAVLESGIKELKDRIDKMEENVAKLDEGVKETQKKFCAKAHAFLKLKKLILLCETDRHMLKFDSLESQLRPHCDPIPADLQVDGKQKPADSTNLEEDVAGPAEAIGPSQGTTELRDPASVETVPLELDEADRAVFDTSDVFSSPDGINSTPRHESPWLQPQRHKDVDPLATAAAVEIPPDGASSAARPPQRGFAQNGPAQMNGSRHTYSVVPNANPLKIILVDNTAMDRNPAADNHTGTAEGEPRRESPEIYGSPLASPDAH